MKFTYKNVAVKIKDWPFYGELVTNIVAVDIIEADKIFKIEYPELCKNGNILNTITVSIKN